MESNAETRQAASPDQLEQEIAETRAAIDRKLDLLQQHFSPRQVAGQLTSALVGQGGIFARNLGVTLRDNPVPAILVGIGLAWLMIASSRDQRPAAVRRDATDSRAPRAAAALAVVERAAARQPALGSPTGTAEPLSAHRGAG
ncbi:MAG: DUF3618 domain-containing protein [Kiloniellaceae bacterium]